MKSKSIILLAVSLGFGLVAAFGISQVLGRGSGTAEAPPQKMKSVLIAKETIDQWAELNEENIEVKEWPEELVPEDAIATMEELAEVVARSRVPKNSPILHDHVIDKKNNGRIDIRPGHTVIAINVDSEDTNGGLLQPGHRVDIMAVFQAPNKNGGNTVFARTFLRNIRVYAIDSQMAVSEDVGASTAATVISVEVTKKQAEKIVLVQRVASLKFALVGDEPGSEEDDGEGTDLMEVLMGNKGRANFENAQVAQSQRAVDREKSSQPAIFNPVSQPAEKEYKMTIVGSSGAQVYRWKEGETPTLDDPTAQMPPENAAPVNLPPGVNPPGMTPPTKDEDQANPESKSGSNVGKNEDEFGE